MTGVRNGHNSLPPPHHHHRRRRWLLTAGCFIASFAFWSTYNAHWIISRSNSSNNMDLLYTTTRGDGTLWFHDHVDPSLLYINLPRHVQRRKHLEQLFKDIGYFHPIRFESACPSCPSSSDDHVILSHIRLLHRVAQEAHSRYVMIAEDEIELALQLNRSDFLLSLEREMQSGVVATSNYGFMYLGVCLTSEMEATCTPQSCSAFGIHSYMVTPKAARKIIRSIEEKHGKYDLDAYRGLGIALNEIIGAVPVLGHSYTHDHIMGGWRGYFYEARTSDWRNAIDRTMRSSNHNSTQHRHVIIAHEPRYDQLGSFVTPTLLLYAIASYHKWELEIISYAGTEQEKTLRDLFNRGNNVDKEWGTGMIDNSFRKDFDPVKTNTDSYEIMGFFPKPSETAKSKQWIRMDTVPAPGTELDDACDEISEDHGIDCNIMLSGEPGAMENYMERMGGFDKFITSEFRASARTKFLQHNRHRLKHYVEGQYNVAMHVRRGDINELRERWIEQSVYAALARRICRTHPEAHIHVFSAGKNPDGDWTALEQITSSIDNTPKCASVSFHLDEVEFDTWTHMVAADELIMSRSNFGLIPALLSGGEVHYPKGYWHLRLNSFRVYDDTTGEPIS